jgi:hypothetical protein
MAFARITGEGLAAIAVLVALLWGCILMENSVTKKARRETARVLLDLRKMKGGKVVPASQPVGWPLVSRPVAG